MIGRILARTALLAIVVADTVIGHAETVWRRLAEGEQPHRYPGPGPVWCEAAAEWDHDWLDGRCQECGVQA